MILSAILLILNLGKQNVKVLTLNLKKYKPETYLGSPQLLRWTFLGH